MRAGGARGTGGDGGLMGDLGHRADIGRNFRGAIWIDRTWAAISSVARAVWVRLFRRLGLLGSTQGI